MALVQADSFQKFLFDDLHIRGQWIRLGSSFEEAVKGHDYPAPLKALVGQTAAASLLLSGTLKFEGRLSLHARGSGPVTLLMAEATHEKTFRCIATSSHRVEEEKPLRELLGEAQLAITIEPAKGQRYQGIVPVEQDAFADCVAEYFAMSEQLDTFLLLEQKDDYVVGLMLQKLPDYKEIEDQDAWDRVKQLAQTLSADEFASTDNQTLTTRLYHEEVVQLFDAEPISFKCTCSRERSLASLEALGHAEALQILQEEEKINVDCHFCRAHYEFGLEDVNALFGVDRLH